MSSDMVNLDVKGMVIQMHIVVNDDGSLTARMGEGNVHLSASDAPALSTSRSITLKSVKEEDEEPVLMTESEMGAKLTGLIREAIEGCIEDDNNLCTHNIDSRADWNAKIQKSIGGIIEYYKDSAKPYVPPTPDENED